LLDYTYVKPLLEIIRANREQFEAVFPDFELTNSMFDYIAKVRNTIAHARVLHAHERALLEGISGEIRASLANYRMEQQVVSQHYARIESVIDNFGTQGDTDADVVYMPPSLAPVPRRLSVGDKVTFDCTAWDGRGRAIEWSLMIGSSGYIDILPWTPKAIGTNVSIQYTISERDVRELTYIIVVMRNSSKHHLHHGATSYDDARYFKYAVNPPYED
jgi:hypothetical protein